MPFVCILSGGVGESALHYTGIQKKKIYLEKKRNEFMVHCILLFNHRLSCQFQRNTIWKTCKYFSQIFCTLMIIRTAKLAL